MEKVSLSKIAEIQEASLRSLTDEDNASIIRNFAETAIRVLGADFGVAWGKFNDDKDYKLIYRSPSAPKDIVQSKNKVKNSVTIPVRYGDHVHGNIMLGYKKPHNLTKEKLVLKEIISGIVAQAVTINWLVENEQKALALAEKQKATEVLLEQEKLKTEFIANATHEFRTPLAIMRGNVELALRDKKTSLEAARAALKVVDTEIIKLSALLSDLALLTNPKSDEKRIAHTTKIDLVDLLTKILGRLVVLARSKKISLKINNKFDTLKIIGDEKYLEKLFINLFRNAIVYGKENGIIKLDIEKGKNRAIIKITDDGIGISKADLPHIFERFYRTDKARMMTNIGTGLGLAISKSVVESHGGSISVKSIEGKGTTFTVELPVTNAKAVKKLA